MDRKKQGAYYTQRNNTIKPQSSCNVTAMINALSAALWPVEKLATEKYPQPEDALMHLILSDETIDRMWKRIDPQCKYPPNEWHSILCCATNMILRNNALLQKGEVAVFFSEKNTIDDFKKCLYSGGAVVASGVFEANGKRVNHVVAIVAYEMDSEHPTWIINDSYGDYRTGYTDMDGKGVRMKFDDFVGNIKPCGQFVKLGHLVQAYKDGSGNV